LVFFRQDIGYLKSIRSSSKQGTLIILLFLVFSKVILLGLDDLFPGVTGFLHIGFLINAHLFLIRIFKEKGNDLVGVWKRDFWFHD
jgi:hypothetical protein